MLKSFALRQYIKTGCPGNKPIALSPRGNSSDLTTGGYAFQMRLALIYPMPLISRGPSLQKRMAWSSMAILASSIASQKIHSILW